MTAMSCTWPPILPASAGFQCSRRRRRELHIGPAAPRGRLPPASHMEAEPERPPTPLAGMAAATPQPLDQDMQDTAQFCSC